MDPQTNIQKSWKRYTHIQQPVIIINSYEQLH